MSTSFYKRELPLIITTIIAVISITEFFIPYAPIVSIAKLINTSGIIIVAVFMGAGVINVSKSHIKKINARKPMWQLSIWFMTILMITILSGIIPPMTKSPIFSWLYTNVYSTLTLAIVSLLGFWLVSIAFRAFKFRSWESSIMILFAIIQMIRNAPIGTALFPWIAAIGDWNTRTIAMSSYRTATLGGALGVIAVGIRVLLGKEKGYLGIVEEEE